MTAGKGVIAGQEGVALCGREVSGTVSQRASGGKENNGNNCI